MEGPAFGSLMGVGVPGGGAWGRGAGVGGSRGGRLARERGRLVQGEGWLVRRRGWWSAQSCGALVGGWGLQMFACMGG